MDNPVLKLLEDVCLTCRYCPLYMEPVVPNVAPEELELLFTAKVPLLPDIVTVVGALEPWMPAIAVEAV